MSDAANGSVANVGEALSDAPESDLLRRQLLQAGTAGLAVAGIGFAAVPFIESLNPSERARALGAPVEIDIGKLAPGAMMTVQWRQKPVWVLRRLSSQLDELPKLNDRLKDPLSKEPQQAPNLPDWNPVQRSIKPEYLVLVGICTHLGCSPKYRTIEEAGNLGSSWPGGFYCPCHGSRYDLAGRVMQGSPAPLNLPVPAHYYKNPAVIVAGDLSNGAESDWQPKIW